MDQPGLARCAVGLVSARHRARGARKAAGASPANPALLARVGGVAVICGALLLVAGPGASAAGLPSTAAIVKRAKASTLGAKSVDIAGHVEVEGRYEWFHLAGTYPSNFRASAHYEGASFSLILIGGTAYLKGDARYYLTLADLPIDRAHALAGHWYRTPTKSLSPVAADIAPKNFERALFARISPTEPFHEGLARMRSQIVYVLKDPTGEVYISAGHNPYILRVRSVLKGHQGVLNLAGFDHVPPVQAPRGATPLSQAMGAAP